MNEMETAMQEMCQGVALTWVCPGIYWLVLIVHTFEVESDADTVGAGADPGVVQDGPRCRHGRCFVVLLKTDDDEIQ